MSNREKNKEEEYQPKRFRDEKPLRQKLTEKANKAEDAPDAAAPQEEAAPLQEAPAPDTEAADVQQAEQPPVDPDTVFDYVVPQETFKQHAKRKHRSTHTGKTKIATEEEIDNAVDGYIFMNMKKRRRKHRSHHHHHRRWRRIPLWLRIVIIVVAVILALLIALAGAYLVLNEMGRSAMHSYEDISIVTPTEDASGEELADVMDNGRTIVYDGKTYEFNEDIISVAFIGADEGQGEDVGLNMADAIYIMTVDAKTGRVVILGVSRDTMAYVNLYSANGNYIDSERMQIAYSYAYGSDVVTGGDNTVTSLSRLFFGLPLKNYFAINLDALTTLNDTIGGVTLTSSMTFVSPIDGRTVNAGDTVTLHGKEAERYVRARDTEVLASNNDRMQRQVEYIRGFISSVIPAAKKDLSIVTDLYKAVQVNSDTTLNMSKITYIASTALSKINSAADIEYVSLTGEITAGEHAEMNLTDDEVLRTMLDIFYTPVAPR